MNNNTLSNEFNILVLEGKLSELQKENRHLRDLIAFYEERAETGEIEYVGSKSGKYFHRQVCKWMQQVKPYNMVIWRSHVEAAKDRKPCKTCRA